jgi:hypothetical protein
MCGRYMEGTRLITLEKWWTGCGILFENIAVKAGVVEHSGKVVRWCSAETVMSNQTNNPCHNKVTELKMRRLTSVL